MKKEVVGVGALVIREGKMLIVQRAKYPWKGAWTIVGGKVNKGETAEESVAREVLEEIGVKFKIIRKVKTYIKEFSDSIYKIIVFEGDVLGDIKIKKDEISNLRWIAPLDVLKLDLAGSMKEITEDLIKTHEKQNRR